MKLKLFSFFIFTLIFFSSCDVFCDYDCKMEKYSKGKGPWPGLPPPETQSTLQNNQISEDIECTVGENYFYIIDSNSVGSGSVFSLVKLSKEDAASLKSTRQSIDNIYYQAQILRDEYMTANPGATRELTLYENFLDGNLDPDYLGNPTADEFYQMYFTMIQNLEDILRSKDTYTKIVEDIKYSGPLQKINGHLTDLEEFFDCSYNVVGTEIVYEWYMEALGESVGPPGGG